MNWPKIYDKFCGCGLGIPRSFCGCRWENTEECYLCLSYEIKDKSIIQKSFLLAKLILKWFYWVKIINTVNTIKVRLEKFKKLW